MLTTSEVLRAARALIDTPEKWCQGTQGRDRNGLRDDRNPVSLCMVGACKVAAGVPLPTPYGDIAHIADFLARATGAITPAAFNDRNTTTHADVIAAFDRAIADAEAIEAEHATTPVSDPEFSDHYAAVVA